MAEVRLSATEAALENQRIGALQVRVVVLCTLIQICDAYDVNAIAVTVPSLTHTWNLPGPAFTQAFVWSSIGILVGALSAGPIGDRLGRKGANQNADARPHESLGESRPGEVPGMRQ